MKFGHVELPVSDPARSARWYGDVLGFRLVAEQGERFFWVARDGIEILLRPAETLGPPGPLGLGLVLYLDLPAEASPDARAAELARIERGVRACGEVVERRGDCLHLRDPDGHAWQVVDPQGDHTEGETAVAGDCANQVEDVPFSQAAFQEAPEPSWGADLPVLRTERLTLRGLRPEDGPEILEIFGDPKVMRFWLHGPLTDLAAARRYIDRARDGFREGIALTWGVATREDDRIVGTTTLFRWERQHARAEVGYALGRRGWGRGWASEALAEVVRFAFEELDLHRLEADVDPRNARSIRVLTRAGFRLEGYQRERYRVFGEIQDGAIFALLRPEWAARRR